VRVNKPKIRVVNNLKSDLKSYLVQYPIDGASIDIDDITNAQCEWCATMNNRPSRVVTEKRNLRKITTIITVYKASSQRPCLIPPVRAVVEVRSAPSSVLGEKILPEHQQQLLNSRRMKW
jgi:hypothetical protein